MRRFHSFFAFGGVLLASCSLLLLTIPIHAATVQSGDLIKASGPALYYLGADQKRYVFPTEKTYFSWYKDFSSVKTISDAELASYALGGNVTYRPGVKMVKITTDPKVYAIDAGGTLRWVQTESAAGTLYGLDWTKKIDDIPDAFFINYKLGTPVAGAADFSPSARINIASSINIDKNLAAIPYPAPAAPPTEQIVPPSQPATTSTVPVATYSTVLTVSDERPSMGKRITVLASANQSKLISNIKIFFAGTLQKTCESTPCSVDILIPSSGTLSTYEIRAETTWIDGHTHVATQAIYPDLLANAGINIRLGRVEARPNQSYDVIANVESDFIARYIDIYVDGNNVRGCNNVQECRYLGTASSTAGAVHEIYAIARSLAGTTRRTGVKMITVVNNDHPQITLVPNKSSVPTGETLDVSVVVNDDDGVAWTEIWANNQMLKHCTFGTCTITIGPWNQAQTLNVVGSAQDLTGLTATGTISIIPIE